MCSPSKPLFLSTEATVLTFERDEPVREYRRSTPLLTLLSLGTVILRRHDPTWTWSLQRGPGYVIGRRQGPPSSLIPREFIYQNRGLHRNGDQNNGNNSKTGKLVANLRQARVYKCVAVFFIPCVTPAFSTRSRKSNYTHETPLPFVATAFPPRSRNVNAPLKKPPFPVLRLRFHHATEKPNSPLLRLRFHPATEKPTSPINPFPVLRLRFYPEIGKPNAPMEPLFPVLRLLNHPATKKPTAPVKLFP